MHHRVAFVVDGARVDVFMHSKLEDFRMHRRIEREMSVQERISTRAQLEQAACFEQRQEQKPRAPERILNIIHMQRVQIAGVAGVQAKVAQGGVDKRADVSCPG